MSRTIKVGATLVVVFFVCSLAYFVHTLRLSSRVTPPETVKTFGDFLEWRQPDGGLFLITRDDGQYLEARGRVGEGGASGCPCYLFNENGTLIDWSPDNGSHPDYTRKWYARTDMERVIDLDQNRPPPEHEVKEWRRAKPEEVERFRGGGGSAR